MPLVTARSQVLEVYGRAAERGWVVPTFCAENLTTLEAVLSAALEHGERTGCGRLPVTVALTNLYPHRSQSSNYTRTGRWETGLRLFMADLGVLTSEGSPFAGLDVMVHLDHIQPELDAALLSWNLAQFSSIMFDASALPLDRNMEATARFVERRGGEIVIEGACDEIADASRGGAGPITTPERAEAYVRATGVDFVVANLGTEHRASAADLEYRPDAARAICRRIGPRLVLHGCSSVPAERVRALFSDGVCKVNLWTALERDSSPPLLEDMVKNAARVAGGAAAARLAEQGYLGPAADLSSGASLDFFTTTYRQGLVFREMRRIVAEYLSLWYVS